MFTKSEAKRLRKVYSAVFLNKEGQEVLADLMKRFHVLDTTVARDGYGRIDDAATNINEGERLAVLHIMAMLNINPSQFADKVKKMTNNTDDKE